MDNSPRHRLALPLCAALLATSLGAGCTMVGPDFVRPDADVAGEWQEAQSANLDTSTTDYEQWWTAFNDPVLDGLIEAAYRQNLPLQIAGLRILEARAQLGVAVGGLYPQSQTANAAGIYSRGSENRANTVFGDLNYWDYSVDGGVAWEADFWGKFRRAIESADANLLASIADYDAFLVTLTAEVAAVYVALRTFEERLAIARENVAIQQRSLEIADVLFRNGATTELDVRQAETLLRSTEAVIPVLEAGLRQAQNALSILLGRPPGEVRAMLGDATAIPIAPSRVAVGIPADLLRRRPDVRRAELEAWTQSARIGVAKADLYPSIALFGTIGLAAGDSPATARSGSDDLIDSDALFFQGGPTLTWNVFNYGRIKNSVRVQDARLQQLIVNYQETVLRAAQEAEDAMVAFLNFQQQAAALGLSVAAAKRSVDLALIQYRDGAVDYTRVLNTQQSLVRAQDDHIRSRGDIALNLVALYRSLGGGWQIREGNDFVPEQTTNTMAERTDWGGLLSPDAVDVPPPREAADSLRRFDR